MVQFRCHQCGEIHDELPDLAFTFPDYWLQVDNPEEQKDHHVTADMCRIDNDYFIRGCLEIPITDLEGTFAYGIWISVSKSNFKRYADHLKNNSLNSSDSYHGYLSNSVPGIAETLNLIATAKVRMELRPQVELQSDDHPLAQLQRDGVSTEQLLDLVGDYIH